MRRLAQGDTRFLKDGLAQISRPAADALKQYAADRPAGIAPESGGGSEGDRRVDRRKVRASQLGEPGKSDVLFELGVKEQQFEKALAAALEISVPDHGSLQRKRRRDRCSRTQRGGPTFTIAIPGPDFRGAGADFQSQGPESLSRRERRLFASDGKSWTICRNAPR